jgi:hypothetical protein
MVVIAAATVVTAMVITIAIATTASAASIAIALVRTVATIPSAAAICPIEALARPTCNGAVDQRRRDGRTLIDLRWRKDVPPIESNAASLEIAFGKRLALLSGEDGTWALGHCRDWRRDEQSSGRNQAYGGTCQSRLDLTHRGSPEHCQSAKLRMYSAVKPEADVGRPILTNPQWAGFICSEAAQGLGIRSRQKLGTRSHRKPVQSPNERRPLGGA